MLKKSFPELAVKEKKMYKNEDDQSYFIKKNKALRL